MAIPPLIESPSIDDTQSIDVNLETLKSKYIQPIDDMRSYSSPNILDNRRNTAGQSKASQEELNQAGMNLDLKESRAHAFYRMLGLPVVGTDGSFYNPGYNPVISKDERDYNERVAKSVSQIIKKMQQNRENEARKRLKIFDRLGTEASVFAVAMGVQTGQRKFNVRNDTAGIFDDDKQESSIPERRAFLKRNYKQPNGDELTYFNDTVQHRIRPLMVDPTIERTVKPQRRIVAQPFLATKSDTRIEKGVFACRPGIEFVLRMRLRQYNDKGELASALNGSVKSVFDSIKGLSVSDLAFAASAVLDEENVSAEDINNLILDRTTVEIFNINTLVKTIKAVIKNYISTLNSLTKTVKTINWTPLPNVGGPEKGTEVNNFIRVKNRNSKLEERITNMTIKQAISKRQVSLGENLSASDFCISQFENPEILFNDEIAEAKSQRANLERYGSNALKYIELVTGEVSGLGLIDILAVYTALWAVELDTLVSLLDNNAFNRLYQNKDLRTESVKTRRTEGAQFSGTEALTIFENQVFSVLSFTDRLIDISRGNPRNAEGGFIARV